jgi:hypothetical protein
VFLDVVNVVDLLHELPVAFLAFKLGILLVDLPVRVQAARRHEYLAAVGALNGLFDGCLRVLLGPMLDVQLFGIELFITFLADYHFFLPHIVHHGFVVLQVRLLHESFSA